MKKDTITDEVERPDHVFQLSETEKKDKLFRLRYNAKDDKYYRYCEDKEEIKGWRNGIYTMVNVRRFKKEQNGCELVYLTRKPGYATASVSWKLDFRNSDLVVDTIQAITYSRTETGGQITYDMATEDPIDNGALLNGWQTIVIIAYLDGGIAPCEHSQTQLLYQNATKEPEFCPLDITITLKPLEKLFCTCIAKGGLLKSKSDKVDKHRPSSSIDVEASGEPVCSCDECTCKRYNRKHASVAGDGMVTVPEGDMKIVKLSKGKEAKRKARKPPEKVKSGGKKTKHSHRKEIILQVPAGAKAAPVPDFFVVGELPAHNGTSSVSVGSDACDLAKAFGSRTSVQASTSKDATTNMHRQSLHLNILTRKTSQGKTKEAWGERADEKQIGPNEQTDNDDTTPLTPSREDKKCTIL